MTTGERISILRESRNVLQKELARVIKIDPVVLNRIEKGKRAARDEELKAIADYFNVSADYLLGRDTPKTPYLSVEQATVLSTFDTLSTEGRNLFIGMLNSLSLTHSKVKEKAASVVQKNSGGTNILATGGNNNYSIVTS